MGKYSLRNGDVISGGLLAALGVYIVLQARNWNYYGPDGPGPAFFPIWYGLTMAALALVLVVRTVLRGEAKKENAPVPPGTLRALATWLAFAATVALMGPLGFLLSFALFSFFLVAVVFRRSLTVAAVTAICIAAAFHLTFVIALGVELPTGLLGF